MNEMHTMRPGLSNPFNAALTAAITRLETHIRLAGLPIEIVDVDRDTTWATVRLRPTSAMMALDLVLLIEEADGLAPFELTARMLLLVSRFLRHGRLGNRILGSIRQKLREELVRKGQSHLPVRIVGGTIVCEGARHECIEVDVELIGQHLHMVIESYSLAFRGALGWVFGRIEDDQQLLFDRRQEALVHGATGRVSRIALAILGRLGRLHLMATLRLLDDNPRDIDHVVALKHHARLSMFWMEGRVVMHVQHPRFELLGTALKTPGQTLPEAVVIAAAGRPLQDLGAFPLLDPNTVIREVRNENDDTIVIELEDDWPFFSVASGLIWDGPVCTK